VKYRYVYECWLTAAATPASEAAIPCAFKYGERGEESAAASNRGIRGEA
jgi:hypothetical protein